MYLCLCITCAQTVPPRVDAVLQLTAGWSEFNLSWSKITCWKRLEPDGRTNRARSVISVCATLSGINPQRVAHTKCTYPQPDSEYGMCH